MRSANLIMSIVIPLVLVGCSSLPTVSRVDQEETHDLSGYWNDTDSRLVSEEMVDDMLSRAWLSGHVNRSGKNPTVIVGTIKNLSHEHINTNTFIKDIERELINSGSVEFVASSSERGEIRDERMDQDLHAREDTRSEMGQEIGADYMMSGTINTIIDAAGKKQVTFYQVDLQLISMRDNRKVWIGQKKLKKLITGRSFRY